MASDAYSALDKAWRGTCRVLFGQEAGGLSDCAGWLSEYAEEIRSEKSSISGKAVTFTQNEYSGSARFMAFDEIGYGKKFAPIPLDDMKDIDSLVTAAKERLQYAGNVVLGHSSGVQNSSNVTDSHYVLDSTAVASSKYVAYSKYIKESEYCFGVFGAEKDAYLVKSMGSSLKRCFECHMVNYLSDCYYCAKTQNCRECFFCFGMENGSYAIGNTPVGKEKYLALKAKLLPEIAEKIRKDGRIFSLLKLIEEAGAHKPDSRLKFAKEKEAAFDIAPVQKGFDSACRLVFGKEMGEIGKYEKFLFKHVPKNVVVPSPLSGSASVVCGYRRHVLNKFEIARRLPTEDEIRSVGKLAGMVKTDVGGMELSALAEQFHPIAYTNLDKVAGKCTNFRNCAVIIESQDCLEGSAFDYSKKCGYNFWASNAESVFGSCAAWFSTFVLKNFYSKNMTRSLECDGCESCTDLYYSHNCENVRDSMFCFNAKNLTNAVGNAPLPAEQYRKMKGAIVAQLADELEKKKDLKWDIFNIGAISK
ncbi:MAG: hypothetical protein WCT52_01610 [Candidatus Micrarchaeia archaeon]